MSIRPSGDRTHTLPISPAPAGTTMSSPMSSGGDPSLSEEPRRSLSSDTKDATHAIAPPDNNEPPLNRPTLDGGSDSSSPSDALVLTSILGCHRPNPHENAQTLGLKRQRGGRGD
ncbi:hypothetical protein MLD38_034077 [Melastoma candidum]|uniref:Uncharacterized protein n=1 Tax=Melastoma candidum TaxID=119954 RepID=A0ACB9M8S6_9MYRT|nr:hypothetical protein MLD38_034077 [Melastoma candidum]